MSYREDVLRHLREMVLGLLDEDVPPIVVDRLEDLTDRAEALGVRVHYRVGDGPTLTDEFRWIEWDPHVDQHPDSMASLLSMLIHTDLREEVATGQRHRR